MKTKQIVFTKVNTAELLERECLPPTADEVTVDLQFSAISSGTERSNITGQRNGPGQKEDAVAVFPRYCGYSAAGIVSAVGENVTDIKIGDNVLIFWGAHKKNITISRKKVVKIPDGVSLEEAAITFISTFPLAAIRKTKLEIGESALVMGLGILGIFAVKLLKAAGAYPIIAVDPVEERRNIALDCGADFAFDPTDSNFVNNVRNAGGGGVSVCIEVTGLGIGLDQALDCMKQFGRIALLGCTRNSDFTIDYYNKVHAPGISLIGAHTMARPKNESYPGYWTESDDIMSLLKLIKGKRLNYKDIIFEIDKPEDCTEVYNRLVNDRNFPVGVLFDWRETN